VPKLTRVVLFCHRGALTPRSSGFSMQPCGEAFASSARVRLFTLVSAKVLRVHDWQVWLLRDLHHHMERRPKPLASAP
jgi:hypothetical protein